MVLQLCPERIHTRHLFAYFYRTLTTSVTLQFAVAQEMSEGKFLKSPTHADIWLKQAGLRINLLKLGLSDFSIFYPRT